MYLATMNWETAKESINEFKIAVLVVGSLEQHGPSCPLGTDFFIPEEIARRLESSHHNDVIIFPAINYGVCGYHMGFSGTIDIGADLLSLLLSKIINSAMKQGFRRFLIINGHGGNSGVLDLISHDISTQGGLGAVIDWWRLAGEINSKWRGGHADAIETSVMMAINPEWVKSPTPFSFKSKSLGEKLSNVDLFNVEIKDRKGSIRIIRDIKQISESGEWRSPIVEEKPSVELGEKILSEVTLFISEFISIFQTVSIRNNEEIEGGLCFK